MEKKNENYHLGFRAYGQALQAPLDSLLCSPFATILSMQVEWPVFYWSLCSAGT